jgi:hypothetical protein
MGVSCAPYLANLMMFMYELEFFDDFISTHNPIRNKTARQLLWKLSCCTRYIDDLWNPLVTKEKFQSFTRRIYPTWLQLGEPESEGKIVNYLDRSIWQQDGTWQSKLYDKRVALQSKGLKLNKFPHPDTKITTRCKYGVISSQLHRFKTVCTQTSQFLDAATTLYTEYIDKGYDQRLVDKRIHKFLSRERDTLTIKPTAIKYRYQKQQLRARKLPGRSTALKSIYQNMLGPILPRRYVGPNENYTDSTNIKKRRQRTVEMGCTNWDSGLTSGGISVSPFHYDACPDFTCSLHLK